MARKLTRGQRAAAEKARLRAEENRLTQKDLADELGLSEKAVWNFLNGKSWPFGRTLAGYERVLGWHQGYLTEIVKRFDSDVQQLDDAAPEERRLLELVQELRIALDDLPVAEHSQAVARELKRLTAQLVDLGGGHYQNVRPLKLRPLSEIDADIERERELRADTLASGMPGALDIVRDVHDAKIAALEAERELTVAHSRSGVTGS
jgi:transcriptional regulator with XRE-family HTH domain